MAARYAATAPETDRLADARWRVTPRDVYRLTQFDVRVPLPSNARPGQKRADPARRKREGAALRLAAGPSDLVIGHIHGAACWAVIIPDHPGDAAGRAIGERRRFAHLWLQINPRDLARLFPAETVEPAHATHALNAARTIAWTQQPTSPDPLPPPGVIVAQFDSLNRNRHGFRIILDRSQVHHLPDHGDAKGLPPAKKLAAGASLAAFERVWRTFERSYPLFHLRPNVDWSELRARLRERTLKVATDADLLCLLADLLAPLEDAHAVLEFHGLDVLYDQPRRIANIAPDRLSRELSGVKRVHSDVLCAALPHNVGYLRIESWRDPGVVEAFDQALYTHHTSDALILDLRMNGGGAEETARQVAARFVDRQRDYALYRKRSGPEHGQLTRPQVRTLRPRGWRYSMPVAVLIGPATASASEDFVLMMKQCPQVVVIGEPTAGSSGNPTWVEAVQGIRVGVPQWLDLRPDGVPVEGNGIPPDVRIHWSDMSLETGDPVVSAALAELDRRITLMRQPAIKPPPATNRFRE